MSDTLEPSRLVCAGCDRPHSKKESRRLHDEIVADLRAWKIGEHPFDHWTKVQRRSLEKRDITTIGDLLDLGSEKLTEECGFGPASIEELRDRMRFAISLLFEWSHVRRERGTE